MEYKNLYSYKDFLNEKNIINEGLLGKLFGFLGKQLKHFASKILAAKVIDPIVDKYKEKLPDLFKKSEIVALLKSQTEKFKKGTSDVKEETQAVQKETEKLQTESLNEKLEDTIKKNATEQQEAEKNNPIMKHVNELLDKMKEEIKAALVVKNIGVTDDKKDITLLTKSYIQLRAVEIQDEIIKKSMEWVVSNAEMDKNAAEEMFKTQTEKLAKATKELSAGLETELDKKGDTIEYKEGDEVTYLLDDGKDEYNKLSDEDKKDDEKIKDLTSTNKISKIDGDTFTLLDKNGEPKIKKRKDEILSKKEQAEEQKEESYKVGDVIEYKSEKSDSDEKFKNEIVEIKDDIVIVKNKEGKTFDIKKENIIEGVEETPKKNKVDSAFGED